MCVSARLLPSLIWHAFTKQAEAALRIVQCSGVDVMEGDGLSCSICSDSFDGSDNLCSTVCGHIFHFSCLSQWQERSNTCPLCNRAHPQPHRLFLDLKGVAAAQSSKNDEDDNHENCKVLIKGLNLSEFLSERLSGTDVVLGLAKLMQMPLLSSHIKSVEWQNNVLHVTFVSPTYRSKFVDNKFKLKKDVELAKIVIHEALSSQTKELLKHAQKLKDFGYPIVYVKDGRVYAKKNQSGVATYITSQQHVDTLCQEGGKRAGTNTKQQSSISSASTNRTTTTTTSRPLNNKSTTRRYHKSSTSGQQPSNFGHQAATSSWQFNQPTTSSGIRAAAISQPRPAATISQPRPSAPTLDESFDADLSMALRISSVHFDARQRQDLPAPTVRSYQREELPATHYMFSQPNEAINHATNVKSKCFLSKLFDKIFN